MEIVPFANSSSSAVGSAIKPLLKVNPLSLSLIVISHPHLLCELDERGANGDLVDVENSVPVAVFHLVSAQIRIVGYRWNGERLQGSH